jgi:hypothetical protein
MKKQHISQNFTVQYKYSEKDTSYKTHKKKTEKQQNTKTKKKQLLGIVPRLSSL